MKKAIYFFLFFAISLLLIANPNEQLLDRMGRKYQNFSTFEADIVQENSFTQINFNLSSRGKVFMQNNSVVIEFQEPLNQFIKLVNNEITIYSRQENIAIISSQGGGYTQALLQFSSLLNRDLRFIEKTGNILTFEVQNPIAASLNMKFFINESTELIERVTYSEDSSSLVTIQFQNQRFNQPLSKSINSFTIPNGTQIIRQ